MQTELVVISLYASMGFFWLWLSGTSIKSQRLFGKVVFGFLFVLLWPLMLLMRIEKANRVGKYLKPHSKWQLIVKNKVVLRDDEG